MHRLILILCLTPRLSGSHEVQHQMYSHVTRKSRSNSPTVETSYVYSQYGNRPGQLSMYNNQVDKPNLYDFNLRKMKKSADKLGYDMSIMDSHASRELEDSFFPQTTPSMVKRDGDYELERALSDARYDSSRARSDNMVDKLKTLVHYQPSSDALHDVITMYDSGNDYHMDDDDVRTSSRSLYDNWPYFYHSPYEYEHIKDISDTEKAKDKRFAADTVKDVIPVHEHIENDSPHHYDSTPSYFRDRDNPIIGDEPFFSFVLNDYFDRSGDEDPLTFKGLHWGKDFDQDTYFPGTEDVKRNRRLEKDYYTTSRPPLTYPAPTRTSTSKITLAESVTQKYDNNLHEYDKYNTGQSSGSNYNSEFDNKANRYNGFKNFLDSFANKFGVEEHTQSNDYHHESNEDKGESRKGFRRVYHKDEYQEDNEFFDRNNSSTRTNNTGASKAHVNASEGILQSHAAAAVGNESSAANNSGNTNITKVEDSQKGHEAVSNVKNQFNKYIDVAKQAALRNNADYADQFKI
ncbi:unnamed protein product [Chrysodeixis includens]|uniref:Uncharacterized protein n=1 Tax=Chrysodeixis includens TaxID=689277 RepID=A0A9P0BX37_CHRIL|nr:unnamed protein product [Chrysodeixis includens]